MLYLLNIWYIIDKVDNNKQTKIGNLVMLENIDVDNHVFTDIRHKKHIHGYIIKMHMNTRTYKKGNNHTK